MIEGNADAIVEKATTVRNEIGRDVPSWKKERTIKGFLDLSNNDTNVSKFNLKIAESTHVFICDFQDTADLKPQDTRFVIDGEIYDLQYIDDPMKLHDHLEIFLKNVGDYNE